jgi:hypothetical protein
MVLSNVQSYGPTKRMSHDTTRVVKAEHLLSCLPAVGAASRAERYRHVISNILPRAGASNIHSTVVDSHSTGGGVSSSKALAIAQTRSLATIDPVPTTTSRAGRLMECISACRS